MILCMSESLFKLMFGPQSLSLGPQLLSVAVIKLLISLIMVFENHLKMEISGLLHEQT